MTTIQLPQVPAAPPVANTLQKPENAIDRVESALKTLAGAKHWTYANVPCDELRRQWASSNSIVILTTPDCFDASISKSATTVSASVGFPAYFFADGSGKVLSEGKKIGVLDSVANYQSPVSQALDELWHMKVKPVDVYSANYGDLLGKLGTALDFILVIDDGTGSSLAELYRVNRNDSSTEKDIQPALLPGPPASTQVRTADRSPRPLALSGRYVDLPGQGGSGDRAAPVGSVGDLPAIAFGVPRMAAGKPADDRTRWLGALVGSMFGLEATLHAADERPPLPAVAPILVTKGVIDPELFETARRALLAAPVDALMNPCHPDQQNMYRVFVRGAMDKSTPGRDLQLVAAALWEHTKLLENRNQDKDLYSSQRKHVETLLEPATRNQLVDEFSQKQSPVACHVRAKSWFRNNKLALYQQARSRLRDALGAPTLDVSSDAFREAAACLGEAFKKPGGRDPSCGEKGSGMWIDHYAPYLPMAIIETERDHAPRH